MVSTHSPAAHDDAKQRRMSQGARAIMAAVAAMPAAGSVSAQEAAFQVFTGPQTHIAQADGATGSTGPDAVVPVVDASGAEAEAVTSIPTPGEQRGVCITVPSSENAVGGIMTVTLRQSFTRVVETSAPGVLPEGNDDENCMTADEFRMAVDERTNQFVQDTTDFLIDVTKKVGWDSSSLEPMKTPAFMEQQGLVGAHEFVGQVFNRVMGAVQRSAGQVMFSFIVDDQESDALIQRYLNLDAELKVLGTMEAALPRVQQGLDDGSMVPLFTGPGVEVPNPGDRVRFESGPDARQPVAETAAANAAVDDRRQPAAALDERRPAWPGARV
ncbi:MAG: hypothetical protein KI792_05015 [Alphaproteobacteria bacterium]|nr:hypothetical protein [Alphaproteobacteria bacterium SS10]